MARRQPWRDYQKSASLIERAAYHPEGAVAPPQNPGSSLPTSGPLLLERLGQSNTDGHASASLLTDQTLNAINTHVSHYLQIGEGPNPDPITYLYFPGSNNTTPPSTLYPIQPHFHPSIVADAFSHELSMARGLNANNPDRWVFMTLGVEGTGLQDYWIPTATLPVNGGNLYTQSKNATTALLSGRTFVGTVYGGCEGDCTTGNSAKASAIDANLTAFFNQRRIDLGLVPAIVVGINANSNIGNLPFRDTGIAQQKSFCAHYPWSTFIDNSDGVTIDGLHNDPDTCNRLGQRISAAMIAAWNLTTLGVTSFTDSVDPLVADGRSFSYTVVVSNTGSQAAVNPSVVVTVDSQATFVNATGTGWTFTNVGNVVTCTMASMAVGTANPITINCNAPTAIGTGSLNSTLTLVSNNCQTQSTASQGTTLSSPQVTKDATSNIFLQQSSSEYSNFISTQGLTGQVAIPDSMWSLAMASGNAVDLINSLLLTLAGANGFYAQSQTGWTTPFFKTLNASTATFASTDTTLPDISTTSMAIMAICEFSAAPSAPRGVYGAGTTSNYVQLQINNLSKLVAADGANTFTGTVNAIPANADLCLFVHNVTSPTQCCFSNKNEDATFSKGTGTGKQLKLFTTPAGLSDAPMGIVHAFMWKGANAELLSTQANRRALINKQANGNFTVPW